MIVSFVNNQMAWLMLCVGMLKMTNTQCAKGEGWEVLWNGQKTGSLSLRVKRDERVGGLVVGWG